MPWYKTGTVSVTQNSNAVIGTSTAFIANARVGDAFRGPDGGWYEVTNIASDTALSISPNYQGAATNSGLYALAPMQGYVKDSADALRGLVNQFGGILAVLGETPTTAGVRAALNLSDADGLPEGVINKYMTAAGVRGITLTGLDLVTPGAVSATDTILKAFGKLQVSKAPLDSPVFTGQLQGNLPCLVGGVRNAKMTLTAASASGTFTADEVIVKSALGGLAYSIPSFNKTINLAAPNGAGGMDVGAAPAGGYVALYAIYNPSIGTSALLAVNATSIVAPSVYGGTNRPSGYTASALLAVWPTNGSGQLVAGSQQDRAFTYFNGVQALSTNASAGSTISLAIPSILPRNAITTSGTKFITTTATSAGSGNMYLFSHSASAAAWAASVGAVSNAFGHQTTFSGLPITTAQTLYYQCVGPTTPLFQIIITGYTI